MDRRIFLRFGIVSPTLLADHPMRVRRVQFTLDKTIFAQMIVTAHPKPKVAERWRKGWEYRAFEGVGEWYLQTSQRLQLPDHLAGMPGTLMFHTFLIGAAAERRTMMVGTFRREHVAVVIRVLGDHRSELNALAEWFTSRPLPVPWELLWSGAQLQLFIPTSDDFGSKIVVNDSFWP